MKHWKKYAVCIACVCCMAMLTGCGSDDNNKATEKETNAAMTENQPQQTAATRRLKMEMIRRRIMPQEAQKMTWVRRIQLRTQTETAM